jgi:hypothetical protein
VVADSIKPRLPVAKVARSTGLFGILRLLFIENYLLIEICYLMFNGYHAKLSKYIFVKFGQKNITKHSNFQVIWK